MRYILIELRQLIKSYVHSTIYFLRNLAHNDMVVLKLERTVEII